ncbi:MAG: YraN family protein [Saprospiraceae bacterium]|nr:YraN family protein [Saprospiraceae bacterium]
MAILKERGNKGEELAADYLLSLGYKILERNWRWSRAEADIIAKDGEILVFVEVKTRTYPYFGNPEDFVNERKLWMLNDLANRYMELIGHEWEIRFDLLSVILHEPYGHEIKHLKDAWY